MEQPRTILEKGTLVRTNKELEPVGAMNVMPALISNRRTDVVGAIHGVVPGTGGDVYWVRHEDNQIAPYVFSEFELV